VDRNGVSSPEIPETRGRTGTLSRAGLLAYGSFRHSAFPEACQRADRAIQWHAAVAVPDYSGATATDFRDSSVTVFRSALLAVIFASSLETFIC